jgi:hypothetical protein
MGRDIEETGTWIRGGVLFGSLVCGAIVSTWVNSMDERTAATNSPNVALPPTIEYTVSAAGVGAEVIGVEVDQRRMAYIRATN